MSVLGVPAAFLFFALFIAFVAGIIALDVWLYKRGGSNATITYGVRYLISHCPLLTHLLIFLFGLLVGGLMVHFAGCPELFTS